MLFENLKTPMWHFEDGWRHEVIYEIYFWGDEFRTLPPHIRYLEKWKFGIWNCPMFAEHNRTVPNSTKMKILITILLGGYLSLRLVVPPINYAWLNSPAIVLCFLDSEEIQFYLLISACLPKYYFVRLSSRLLFKSFQAL